MPAQPSRKPKPNLSLPAAVPAPQAEAKASQFRIGKFDARKLLENKLLLGGVAGGAMLLIVGVIVLVTSGGGEDETAGNATKQVASDEDDKSAKKRRGDSPNAESRSANPSLLERPRLRTVACNVYTKEPGFFVLVDGEAARTLKGQRLTTPCEIAVTPGEHNLTVVKKGFPDTTQEVSISGPRSFEFSPASDPFADPTGYFASRFPGAEVGAELPLTSLNLGGRVWDPFVSADGLTIWFACDSQEHGKGICFARRATVLEEFGEPEFLITTRSSNLPASPSVTADGLIVAFTIPERNVLWGLARDTLDTPFANKTPFKSSEREDEAWRSAQISSDGLKLYCTQERGGKAATYVTARKARDKKFDGKWNAVPLPGGHACLSRDGLRQYVYDRGKLGRATRRHPTEPFSDAETIAEFTLKKFIRRLQFRQYWVSEDEQWFYYTDDPEQGGNLYVTRIADEPGWGFVAIGKPVEQKEVASISEEPEPDAKPKKATAPAEENQPPADPRTLPLPYAEFRAKLEPLLAQWDFAAAGKLITASQSNPRFAKDKELLAWDLEEVKQMQSFWNDLDQSVKELKPKEPVRVGPVQIEFRKFADGKLTGTVKGSSKEVAKELKEMTPSDLVALVEKVIDRTSEPAHLKIAAFLSAAPEKTTPQTISARLQRAGVSGRTFADRQARRKLHVIEQEFERDNIGIGLKLVEQIVAAGPKSETATQALALRESLYARLEWRPVGNQKWSIANGEYATTGKKAANSFLVSPLEYGNFQLMLEWKTAGGPTAQGGVFFRYQRGETLRGNAFKIQLANDYAIRNQPDKFSTGALFNLTAPRANAVRKEGEWNTLSVRVEGDRVQVSVNGIEVLDTPAIDPKIGQKGYVCLDGEFTGVTYRKVLLYELPATGGAKKGVKIAP